MVDLNIGEKTIPYTVEESDSASRARIEVTPEGVTVTVPADDDMDAQAFVEENRGWVLSKYEEMQDVLARIPQRTFEEGESIPYLGEDHKLVVADIDSPEISDSEIRLPSPAFERGEVPEVLEKFLREEAREHVQDLIAKYGDEIDGEPDTIYIRNQKTKWGSCSSKDNLSFNYRLVMAPREVLEYVVVHELVHLEESDHSPAFWRRLGEILPDYEKPRQWLRENQMELVLSEGDLY